MDRRSWLWRRKSSDKSPGETESSGSASSERHSGEQETVRNSSISYSPKHVQSLEVSLKNVNKHEVDEAARTLNEKLSAAVSDISAKEDLVKQHAKVAEEAVLGWENAEKELSLLKQQLEAALKKSSSLEDRGVHLDAALKECARQLRQTKDEQERIIQNAIIKKTHEWESEKMKLEIKIIELQAQLEAKPESSSPFDHEFHLAIESLEEEKCALKNEIASLRLDLQTRTLELELSTKAAEAASKQHLHSIKKVAQLESEGRRLQAAARKSSLAAEQKLAPNSHSHYVESITDSRQSDAGDRLLSLDNEQGYSDLQASTLNVDLDQFKNEKSNVRSLTTSVEIDLMGDFLEMEKLVASPDGSSCTGHADDSDRASTGDIFLKKELENARVRLSRLEAMVEEMTTGKVEMETSLAAINIRLKSTCDQLVAAEGKLVELQRQLNLVNGEKHALEIELEAAEGKKNELENQLVSVQDENSLLHERINLLDRELVEEKQLSHRLKTRCESIEATETKREEIEFRLESANCEIAELKENICSLEGKLAEEKTLCAELASRCLKMEELKGMKEELDCQLESANFELDNLREKADHFDRKLEEERAFSAGLLAKCQAMESIHEKKKELECQLNARCLEVGMFEEKVNTLERTLEEERIRSTELAANMETAEAMRNELVVQLELSHGEIGILQGKLDTLEKQVLEERAKSEAFATKYQILEHELSGKQNGTKFHSSTSSNAVLKFKQEQYTAIAAGQLADCRRTIASLNQHLKLLANFDDLVIGAEKQEPNGDLPGFREQSKTLDSSISPNNMVISSAASIAQQ